MRLKSQYLPHSLHFATFIPIISHSHRNSDKLLKKKYTRSRVAAAAKNVPKNTVNISNSFFPIQIFDIQLKIAHFHDAEKKIVSFQNNTITLLAYQYGCYYTAKSALHDRN